MSENEFLTHSDCLDFDPNDQIANPCSGKVEFRMPLSPSGRAFPRCDKHWDERLAKEEEANARLGNWRSDVPPPGFDPADAGERWDEEY